MGSTGETDLNLLEITTNIDPAEEYANSAGGQKLCRGKQVAGYLNQPTQLGKRNEAPLGNQKILRGTKLTQSSRDTHRVNCLGNL